MCSIRKKKVHERAHAILKNIRKFIQKYIYVCAYINIYITCHELDDDCGLSGSVKPSRKRKLDQEMPLCLSLDELEHALFDIRI